MGGCIGPGPVLPSGADGPEEGAITPRSLWQHLDALQALVRRGPLGLFSDLDGTLAPVVSRPQESSVPQAIQEALSALAQRLPVVALVTGRSLKDAQDLLPVPGLVYVANHGLERLDTHGYAIAPEAAPHLPQLRAVARSLERRLALEGVALEDKGVSFAVHYRHAPEPAKARQAILTALEEVAGPHGVRIIEGKAVVNVLPPVAVDKGTAVTSLVRAHGLAGAIYLGDDLTDLHAFQALHALARAAPPFQGCSVAVVGEETPPALEAAADYTLQGVPEVERFLMWLTREVRRGDPRRPHPRA